MSVYWVDICKTCNEEVCCGNYARMRENTQLVRVFGDWIMKENGKTAKKRRGGRQDLCVVLCSTNEPSVVIFICYQRVA